MSHSILGLAEINLEVDKNFIPFRVHLVNCKNNEILWEIEHAEEEDGHRVLERVLFEWPCGTWCCTTIRPKEATSTNIGIAGHIYIVDDT